MDFKVYKSRLKEYLQSKGFDNFDMNISCPFHEDKQPSMKVHSDGAQCFSQCGQKDIYDFIGIFENIPEKKNQFFFAEKFFNDHIPVKVTEKKPKFIVDKNYSEKLRAFLKEIRPNYIKQIQAFVNRRGYTGKAGEDYANWIAYWPGYDIASKKIGVETLEKSGIPIPTKEKPYSSWHRPGVVFRLGVGYELLYFDKDGKTVKRCSCGSENFPFPQLPAKSEKVVLVEGGTDALPCVINDIPAVGIGGTQKFKPSHAKQLHIYKEVIICFNPDKPGSEAAIKAREILLQSGYPGKITTVTLPEKVEGIDENRKIDCDELIKTGNLELLKSYLYPKEEIKDPVKGIQLSFKKENALIAEELRTSDEELKNYIFDKPEMAYHEAARLYFVDRYKTGILVQSDSGTIKNTWLYNEKNKKWEIQLEKLGHRPQEMFIDRYSDIWWMEGRKKPFTFNQTIHTDNEITAAFKSMVDSIVKYEDLPFEKSAKDIIISCNNGVLVWNKKEKKFYMEPHSGKHRLTTSPFPFNRIDTKLLNEDQQRRYDVIVEYFKQLTNWILDKDCASKYGYEGGEREQKKLIRLMMAYIGYTLTAWREKCFFVWVGEPDTGKSTLAKLLGSIHSSKLGEVRLARWNTGNAHDYEVLPGKLVVMDDDFAVGGRLPEQELKTLSQNARITINPKHVSQFSITNTATMLILSNGSPRAEDMTIDNRIYVIPFNADFSRDNRNEKTDELIETMQEHDTLEILFNLAIDTAEGTVFKNKKFTPEMLPKCMIYMRNEVMSQASQVSMWLADMAENGRLIVDKSNTEIKIRRTDLWKLYQNEFQGPGKKGQHAFYESVSQQFGRKKTEGGYDFFTGICVKEQDSKNIPFEENN